MTSFDYAVIRVVPRVERQEFINAGVIVSCPEQSFLQARVHLNEARLHALWPELDFQLVRRHLDAIPNITAGKSDAGPIARLSRSQRFHWLVAPRSTVIQVSAVHSGICEHPHSILDELFLRLVLSDEHPPAPPESSGNP